MPVGGTVNSEIKIKRKEKVLSKASPTDQQFISTDASSQVMNQMMNSKSATYESSHSVDRCDECKSDELVINHVEGTIVCQKCGLVQQSRIIDDSSEWRTFSSETSSNGANPSRVGGKLNPYLSNYGIDTQVKG